MSTKREQDESSLWLSVQKAASELEVTTRTIYRFINDGKLAAYRIGRVYRIKRADLDAFLVGAALQPGDLNHLVEDTKSPRSANRDSDNDDNGAHHGDGAPAGRMRSAE
ncbi:MAG: helix-turn-helix domain-containing protein [Actinomycetia bacterium]|nr:helix-turn-helix domain-containing protein [Actinomycetes bacterium]